MCERNTERATRIEVALGLVNLFIELFRGSSTKYKLQLMFEFTRILIYETIFTI